MKKSVLLILCVALFLLAVGGGFAFLFFSPRGVLRSDTPEAVMQSYMDSMDAEKWRAEYCRCCAPAVTAFEDAETVAGHIFDSMQPGSFTFREDIAGDGKIEYIIARGDCDFLRVCTEYSAGHWQLPQAISASSLVGTPRSLSVTVPEGSTVTVNGMAVLPEYIEDDSVLYDDMTSLELRFSQYPRRVRYRIDGLFENAAVDAQREGGLVLLSGGMMEWEYTLPEGGCHTFHITAPADAIVTVNGTELTEADAVASTTMPVPIDIPESALPFLPSYRVYTAGGLYSVPEISAALSDGSVLSPAVNEEGRVFFALPGENPTDEECDKRVKDFIACLLHYGAGHTLQYSPYGYLTSDSELLNYCSRAVNSLYWVVGVTLAIQDITVYDYIPLGDDAFLCQAHAEFSTQTKFQTKDLSQDYQMVWLREGTLWKIYDLAFI